VQCHVEEAVERDARIVAPRRPRTTPMKMKQLVGVGIPVASRNIQAGFHNAARERDEVLSDVDELSRVLWKASAAPHGISRVSGVPGRTPGARPRTPR
jgi:hypothetical protein